MDKQTTIQMLRQRMQRIQTDDDESARKSVHAADIRHERPAASDGCATGRLREAPASPVSEPSQPSDSFVHAQAGGDRSRRANSVSDGHAFGSSGTACAKNERFRRSGKTQMGGRSFGSGPASPKPPNSNENMSVDDALQKIVKLASVRERSQAETYRRLEKAGFDGECAYEAIRKAVAWGIIDDRRFADALARTRIAQGKGCPGIERELRDNGIDPSVLIAWPQSYTEEQGSEVVRASRLLKRKPPRAKNQMQSAYRKLIVNGYSSDVASRAARAWCAHEQSESR